MDNRDKTVAKALVPIWVATALKREGLTLAEIFDLSKIKGVLSREDLAVLHCINQNPSNFLGVEDLGGWLRKQWAATDAVLLEELEKTLELYQGLKEPRLYAGSTAATGSCDESDACTAFEIVKTESVTGVNPSLIVIIRDGAFGTGSTQLQADLRRAFLKSLYDLLDVRELAHDPVFAKFVKDL